MPSRLLLCILTYNCMVDVIVHALSVYDIRDGPEVQL